MRRRVATMSRKARVAATSSLVVTKGGPRDIVKFHEVVGHPGDSIMCNTARVARVQLCGTWSPCLFCSDVRMRMPKSTDNPANRCAGRPFIDISDLYNETPLGVKSFVMLCVDHFSRYTLVCFIKKKSDATEGLQDSIDRDIPPDGHKIGLIRTDCGENLMASSNIFSANTGLSTSQPRLTISS